MISASIVFAKQERRPNNQVLFTVSNHSTNNHNITPHITWSPSAILGHHQHHVYVSARDVGSTNDRETEEYDESEEYDNDARESERKPQFFKTIPTKKPTGANYNTYNHNNISALAGMYIIVLVFS